MKKVFSILMVAVVVFAASCSKNSTSSNSYTFKGTTYNATTISTSSAGLTVTNGSVTNTSNVVATGIAFGTFPTVSGQYRVVGYTGNPVGNQIVVDFVTSSGTSYISTGNDNVNATVTVASNGKINVSIPNIWLQSASTQSDSGQYSANITQP